MKNIKKFLFIFTIIFTGFCCEIKVSAFSCHYNAYAPFETTSKDPKELAYILNFKYAYKKVLNHSNDEYISLLSNLKQKYLVGNKYIKSISVKHYQDDHSNMNKEKIDLTSSDDTWAVLISSSGGTFDVANGALSKTSFYTNSCFDVFAIGNINNIQFAPTIDIDYSNRGFDDIDDVRIKEPMYNAISDEMKKNFYNEHTPILLINSSSDQTLSMATIFIKVGYYGVDFDKEYNIDSIVDKYLGIDGIKNILDVINENDDKDSANNNIVNTIKDSIVKIVDKVDLDSITNDLTELEKFNDNFAVVLNKKDGNFGIRQTLKQYLYGIGSGMSVTEWFNEYAADSKAQYVESLVELLEILNSNETKNEVNSKNELEDLARNYGYCRINFNFDEEKIKEIPEEVTNEFEKVISLNVIDKYWMEQINTMAHLKEGIFLRQYAQDNPLRAYTQEGFELFDDMLENIDKYVTLYLLKAEIRQNIERKEVVKNKSTNDNDTTRKGRTVKKEKIGRNDPCPCGSGKKYKNCCGK